jgi:hypothetical protein
MELSRLLWINWRLDKLMATLIGSARPVFHLNTPDFVEIYTCSL